MPKIRLAAHMVARNEDVWIWYAIQSVINHVDQMLICDTGSTDRTVSVINSIASPKIVFSHHPVTSGMDMSQVRQTMLDSTRADWVFFIDGDEIWPPTALSQSLSALSLDNDYLISSYRNLIGDVYHYQERQAGRYKIGRRQGHITIRFVNLSSLGRLSFRNVYPLEALCLPDGTPLQAYSGAKVQLISSPYLHLTHLRRSSSDNPSLVWRHDFAYELGISMEPNFAYPKSFYLPRPEFVPSPWDTRSLMYTLNAAWQTPLKYLKRRVVP